LIASENFTSSAVLEAVGSVLTNKYAEGYPGDRYYAGCDTIDKVEEIARSRAKELFEASFANVQPHSGASANLAVFFALLKPGDTILGMDLGSGGHLTHGSPANYSGILYDCLNYGVDPVSGLIDMDAVERMAYESRPKMIIAGASAYPRIIDFERFGEIARKVGAILMVDMAHPAGLIATGRHPSALPHAHVVTSTSHKTLRGPRGGFILTNDADIAAAVDKAVFPGTQGGPLEHVIAGKAVAFGEALEPAFADYTGMILANMKAMAQALIDNGVKLVTDGTDNHLALINLSSSSITGKEAERLLEEVSITVNKNAVPGDVRPKTETSGIRIGTAAMTTRGFQPDEAYEIGAFIAEVLTSGSTATRLDAIRMRIKAMLDKHPLYPELG
jgi:glycine hydroxymethyltransferase